MKILFLNYMHASLATMVRSFELARGTSAAGHEVTLAFLHPEFRPPVTFLDTLARAGTARFKILHPRPSPRGAVRRTPGTIGEARPRALGLARQVAGSLRFVPAELRLIREIRPDVVVARPDQVISFVISCGLTRTPLVLDTDGPVEEIEAYWNIKARHFIGFDAWRARRAAAILYISRVCGDLWTSKGIPAENLFLCPNAADPEQFAPPPERERAELRRRLGLEDRVVIGFAANRRRWHGVAELMRAAAVLAGAEPKTALLIIGEAEDGAVPPLDDATKDALASRVVFTGRVPYAAMPLYLGAADVVAVPYPPLPLFHFSPMKMFEALALGMPVVGPDAGQVGEILGEIDPACLYDPRDPNGLTRALRWALRGRSSLGPKGRALIGGRHTWRLRGETVARACERALERTGRRPVERKA